MKRFIKVITMIILICICLCANTVYASKEETAEETGESTGKLLQLKEENLSVKDDYQEKYNSETTGTIAYIINELYIFMIPFTYLIEITCLISLILNCIRKDIWKIIFSVIGLIIPIITYATIGFGKLMFANNESITALIICISAIIINIIVEILALIFCKKGNKKKLSNI